ncbi:hypothetical protein [Sphingobium mellinum]|uniref:hypothetical protein n=1 Tax=Sphingobium mellinum TaxID=1387166 RepID=UPI0030EF2D4B
MKFGLFVCAAVMAAALLPAVAHADDPNDPSMRSAAARARDRATIKRMNQQQLAYVRQRDARMMENYHSANGDREGYQDARADYARRMAAWRRAVAACNAGRWEYCDD